MDALERGDFYASTGPEIRELYLEDGVLHIETSEAAGIYVTTERIKRWSANADGTTPLTGACFELNDYITRSAPGYGNFAPQ